MSPIERPTKRMDQKARAAAKRVGLVARKSRQSIHIDNLGEYMLIDPYTNMVVDGARFDMTAEDVIRFCNNRSGTR